MESFDFAGFTFPRKIYQLPKPCNITGLRKKRELRKSCGQYYSAPVPLTSRTHPGGFFYLDSDFQVGRGWRWADEVDNSIMHTGWFTDDYCSGDKIRGIVISLPHGRFLAGWSMGEGMASNFDGEIYDDAKEAAQAADSLAENAAESEREYQEEERQKEEEEERNQGSDEEETEGY